MPGKFYHNRPDSDGPDGDSRLKHQVDAQVPPPPTVLPNWDEVFKELIRYARDPVPEDQLGHRKLMTQVGRLARQVTAQKRLLAEKDRLISEQQEQIGHLEAQCRAFEAQQREQLLATLFGDFEPYDHDTEGNEPSAN